MQQKTVFSLVMEYAKLSVFTLLLLLVPLLGVLFLTLVIPSAPDYWILSICFGIFLALFFGTELGKLAFLLFYLIQRRVPSKGWSQLTFVVFVSSAFLVILALYAGFVHSPVVQWLESVL